MNKPRRFALRTRRRFRNARYRFALRCKMMYKRFWGILAQLFLRLHLWALAHWRTVIDTSALPYAPDVLQSEESYTATGKRWAHIGRIRGHNISRIGPRPSRRTRYKR